MDALVSMALQSTAMASRNWMLRRLMTQAIRNDPGWQGGNYTAQPRGFKAAVVFYGKLYLVPASTETRGHGTTAMAKFWKDQLGSFLAGVSERRM
ncbi:MAG TPA: hypothetical protein VHW66_21755 [Stellaceae bacterium]|jgi:homoserine acetyltransferase|nr:hypothetical protein [Stellaceae bacterium]